MAFIAAIHNAAVDGAAANLNSVSLHTADPGSDGSNEVSGGSYARKDLTLPSASSGSAAVTDLAFDIPASTTVTHVGFWDDSATPVWQGGFAVDTEETWASAGTATVSVTVSATG